MKLNDTKIEQFASIAMTKLSEKITIFMVGPGLAWSSFGRPGVNPGTNSRKFRQKGQENLNLYFLTTFYLEIYIISNVFKKPIDT